MYENVVLLVLIPISTAVLTSAFEIRLFQIPAPDSLVMLLVVAEVDRFSIVHLTHSSHDPLLQKIAHFS